jgi:hypothetical protein
METRFHYIVPDFQNLKIFSVWYMGTLPARGPPGAWGGGWPADPVPAPPCKPLPYYILYTTTCGGVHFMYVYMYMYTLGQLIRYPVKGCRIQAAFFGPLFRLTLSAVFNLFFVDFLTFRTIRKTYILRIVF